MIDTQTNEKSKEYLMLETFLQKKENNSIELIYSYDDVLTNEQIINIINNKLEVVENELFDGVNTYDLEMDLIENAKSECNLESYFLDDETCSNLRDLLHIDLNIKQLIRNTGLINISFSLYSNYDCINSFHLESSSGYSYEESYFGAMVDALMLNPAEVKKLLVSKNVKVYGKWPNKKRIPYVDYNEFFTELVNQSCGACLLTVLGKLDLQTLTEKSTTYIIPKGNTLGLYSSFQGGGSMINVKLQRDLVIDIKKLGKTKYDHWGLDLDINNQGYSIKETYGVTSEFFGNNVKIKK